MVLNSLINVTSRIIAQNCLHQHLGTANTTTAANYLQDYNLRPLSIPHHPTKLPAQVPGKCNTIVQQTTCRTMENPWPSSRGRGSERNLYCCIGALKSTAQFYCTAADTTCNPPHNWPCALVFSRRQFYCTRRTSYLHTFTIGTRSFHPSSSYSPLTKVYYLPHVRPTGVLQEKTFLFRHLIFSGPWGVLGWIQGNDLGDIHINLSSTGAGRVERDFDAHPMVRWKWERATSKVEGGRCLFLKLESSKIIPFSKNVPNPLNVLTLSLPSAS